MASGTDIGDFTHEGGIITPELIKKATTEAGLDDITQYLEVVTIFEDDDDAVYEGMKKDNGLSSQRTWMLGGGKHGL